MTAAVTVVARMLEPREGEEARLIADVGVAGTATYYRHPANPLDPEPTWFPIAAKCTTAEYLRRCRDNLGWTIEATS